MEELIKHTYSLWRNTIQIGGVNAFVTNYYLVGKLSTSQT